MNLYDLLHIDLGALLRGRIEIGSPSAPRRSGSRLRRAADLLASPKRFIRNRIPVNPAHCLRLVTEQLRRIVACNAPLVPALDAILIDAPYWNVRRALYRLRNTLAAGHSLSGAMQKQPRVFPRYYIDLVRAGENTGSLGRCFDNLIGVLGESERLHRAFALPLMYFATLLIVFGGITTFLCVKVFPVFIDMMADFGAGPPAFFRPLLACMGFLDAIQSFVKALIGLSPIDLSWAIATMVVIVAVCWAWRRGLLRRAASRITLRIPLLGRVAIKANLAHIARVMESLVRAGYPLDEALETAAASDLLGAFKCLLGRLRDAVRRGESLGDACEMEADLLPPWFRGTVSMGESSGDLPTALERIADVYEREVVAAGMIASRFVLPAVVLVMACWVFMVYSFPFVLLTALTDSMISAM